MNGNTLSTGWSGAAAGRPGAKGKIQLCWFLAQLKPPRQASEVERTGVSGARSGPPLGDREARCLMP